ncbi:spore coat protein [Paenibacillus sp. CAA11]|uniref:spore coat protein n=1 Tax=Paenibacillus sp. CAA11 TaxID=1532905 RepID=UPI000D3809CB|nr:spore coat protein [Paenibacillus sp. CAA11]AWB46818.1 spore coat protein [Paenibacillus sp. CAA11]
MTHYPHLAWHETLDMHELVAFQANGLMKLKRSVKEVRDPALRGLYIQAIQALENNLRELLAFYPKAPHPSMARDHLAPDPETSFFAGDLLGLAKTNVRNYAIAITETATPQLREVLTKQINGAIKLHADIFYFMLQRGYYPSYNLDQLLAVDVQNVQRALSM